jgi:hypothetical protein
LKDPEDLDRVRAHSILVAIVALDLLNLLLLVLKCIAFNGGSFPSSTKTLKALPACPSVQVNA